MLDTMINVQVRAVVEQPWKDRQEVKVRGRPVRTKCGWYGDVLFDCGTRDGSEGCWTQELCLHRAYFLEG